jgi:phage-related protein
MPLQTFTPPVPPTSLKKRPKLSILTASFGDGYTQKTADGMNHNRTILELTWETLIPAHADAIASFFEAHKGTDAFLYNGTKFTCDTWQDDTWRGGFRTITATFEESFNLAS